jgi:hypothetical protein
MSLLRWLRCEGRRELDGKLEKGEGAKVKCQSRAWNFFYQESDNENVQQFYELSSEEIYAVSPF